MTAADSSMIEASQSPPRDDSAGPPEWRQAPIAVRDLIGTACDPAQVRAIVPTRTRFDVGLWFRHRRIWACGTDDRLILAAVGLRPYLQIARFAEVHTTFYSHPSGELVLVPVGDLAIRSLVMGPRAGWQFLTLIHGTSGGPSGNSTSASLVQSSSSTTVSSHNPQTTKA